MKKINILRVCFKSFLYSQIRESCETMRIFLCGFHLTLNCFEEWCIAILLDMVDTTEFFIMLADEWRLMQWGINGRNPYFSGEFNHNNINILK